MKNRILAAETSKKVGENTPTINALAVAPLHQKPKR
jgi:hypothetical protein